VGVGGCFLPQNVSFDQAVFWRLAYGRARFGLFKVYGAKHEAD